MKHARSVLGAVRTYAPLAQRLVHTAMTLASLYRCTGKHDCTRFAMVLVLRCMLSNVRVVSAFDLRPGVLS